MIGWSISQGSGGTTMHNYKNNRSIIWAQVQPGPCDDKYNALCTNTNTCITMTNKSMTMCFCVSGPFSPMRLAWVGRCGDTGWIQMSSSREEDDLWSTWQLEFNSRSDPCHPNFPAYLRRWWEWHPWSHMNKFRCKITIFCLCGPPRVTHHHKPYST